MNEIFKRAEESGPPPNIAEEIDASWIESLRLGQDLRFMLVTVGGGAARVGRAIARKHVRYLETVAINCDERVQEIDEFDRRICLGPASGEDPDTHGSCRIGAERARAAEPALHRVFEGATFVTIIGSLGGGSGTGALPYVIEAACRNCEVLSVFAIKPFACEGDRRAVADRALGRLMFLDAFTEKREQRLASLQVLDNESLVSDARKIPVGRLNELWAEEIARHIEQSYIGPAEAVLESARITVATEGLLVNRYPGELVEHVPPPDSGPAPLVGPRMIPLRGPGSEIELTFEVVSPPRPGEGP